MHWILCRLPCSNTATIRSAPMSEDANFIVNNLTYGWPVAFRVQSAKRGPPITDQFFVAFFDNESPAPNCGQHKNWIVLKAHVWFNCPPVGRQNLPNFCVRITTLTTSTMKYTDTTITFIKPNIPHPHDWSVDRFYSYSMTRGDRKIDKGSYCCLAR